MKGGIFDAGSTVSVGAATPGDLAGVVAGALLPRTAGCVAKS